MVKNRGKGKLNDNKYTKVPPPTTYPKHCSRSTNKKYVEPPFACTPHCLAKTTLCWSFRMFKKGQELVSYGANTCRGLVGRRGFDKLEATEGKLLHASVPVCPMLICRRKQLSTLWIFVQNERTHAKSLCKIPINSQGVPILLVVSPFQSKFP